MPQLEVSGSLDVGIVDGYPLGGVGGQFKGLWHTGKQKNAIVAGLGFQRLYEDLGFDAYSYTFLLTDIGYRKYFKSLFVEPKAGLGFCNEFDDNNISALIGVEPGLERQKFRFSIAYRFITSGGVLDGDYFHTLAFRMGYRVF